jgi:hypothetical protein
LTREILTSYVQKHIGRVAAVYYQNLELCREAGILLWVDFVAMNFLRDRIRLSRFSIARGRDNNTAKTLNPLSSQNLHHRAKPHAAT